MSLSSTIPSWKQFEETQKFKHSQAQYRVQDPAERVPEIRDIPSLASGITADPPHEIPENLPTYTARSSQYRHAETSVYPHLDTNIDSRVMEFSQEAIPTVRSELSISKHGPETPFRHHTVLQKYVEGLLDRNGYRDLVEYNTTVERVTKIHETGGWKVTLRKEGPSRTLDYWWTEDFNAVVVASGHYTVPFIPHIQGLVEYARTYPGSVEHSKAFRDPEKYRGKVITSTQNPSPMITDTNKARCCHRGIGIWYGHRSKPYRHCADSCAFIASFEDVGTLILEERLSITLPLRSTPLSRTYIARMASELWYLKTARRYKMLTILFLEPVIAGHCHFSLTYRLEIIVSWIYTFMCLSRMTQH
jgi:hypothetical protein